MKSIYTAFFSLGAVALVTGCGGGGSSGTGVNIPTAAVAINTTNAPAVAKGAATPAKGMTNASSTATLVGVVAQTSAHRPSVLDRSLAGFAQMRAMQLSPSVGVVGVIAGYPMNSPCTAGGSTSMDILDNNNNNTIDSGDVFTMSMSNCNDGFTTDNGNMSFALSNITAGQLATVGTPNNPATASFTLTFNQFSTKNNATGATDSINGDIVFYTSDDGTNTSGTMSGASLTTDSSVDGAFSMTNYNINFIEANAPTATSQFSFSFNMTTASVVAGGKITITTTTPFTGVGNGDATTGVMVITGANNSTLTLTARADGIHVGMTVDEDGASGPVAPVNISPDTTWAAL